ncbi:hypothetical protein PDL71_16300 [Lacibacter sp. MH-610]|jgi:hypothetical protein|uniref:hypothetical protein n=1 Tax=Lacibacter sp. MH-610 TaxID=3020883 RepID=UPI003892B7BB
MFRSVFDDMSNAEREMALYLNSIGLWWEYESAVYILDDKGRPRVWTPDFYLPSLGMYVEVVGDGENPNYSWRMEIYAQNKIPIIFIAPYQNYDWRNELINDIKDIHQQRWEIIKLIR